MTIINNIQNELNEAISIPKAKTRADSLKAMTIGVYEQMVQTFNQGSKTFWNSHDVSPQEIADYLGTNASGIFYLHARLGELLADVDPSAISAGLSAVGTFNQNEDGTITVTSVPTGVII
jgi:hypothetical protein